MLWRLISITSAVFLLTLLGGHETARTGGRRRPNRCPRVGNIVYRGSLCLWSCPFLTLQVKALRNFQIDELMGFWYVVQYYASSEEIPEYACMRSSFSFSSQENRDITMNFSYIYAEDPIKQPLYGNITWFIPNMAVPAHWMHTEYICEREEMSLIREIEETDEFNFRRRNLQHIRSGHRLQVMGSDYALCWEGQVPEISLGFAPGQDTEVADQRDQFSAREIAALRYWYVLYVRHRSGFVWRQQGPSFCWWDQAVRWE